MSGAADHEGDQGAQHFAHFDTWCDLASVETA
jgi:hypothetical protein